MVGNIDILAIEEFERWISMAERPTASISGLDLVPFKKRLAGITLSGCALLGCSIDGELFEQIQRDGCSLISAASGLPFDPNRSTIYSVEDLYNHYDPADSSATWRASFDYLNYRWFVDEADQIPRKLSMAEAIHARLHDTAIEAAVGRFIDAMNKPVVGFMGGHDTPRDAPVFATVAALARNLARAGLLVLSGGGPGLMEAANLGAFLSPYPDDTLGEVIATLAVAPKYSDPDWLSAGWNARKKLLAGSQPLAGSVSLGIPTWLYGFEPPNVFATSQAKMFYNSLREDGLVTLAGAGLVIGPGNAGTVQEIFQDTTQNYYRRSGVGPTPIALLDEAFWSRPAEDGPDPAKRTKPLRPLLMALAQEKPASDWSDAVLFTDDAAAIENHILAAHRKTGAATRGEHWRTMQRGNICGG